MCNRAIGTTEVPCIQMQKSAILATRDSMGAIDREFGTAGSGDFVHDVSVEGPLSTHFDKNLHFLPS